MKTNSDRQRVLKYVRARAGIKMFTEDVAEATGVPIRTVMNAIRGSANGHTDYHFERVRLNHGNMLYKVWYGVTPEENATDLCKRITRWMHRPACRASRRMAGSRSATVAMLAKALQTPPEEISAELESMRENGHVVRCELVLRSGWERFEYRLMGVA